MAENILKLKLDSNEYNNKLRNATKELLDFTEQTRRSGRSMAEADQDAIEYVRALGQMTTSASTAKGKLREMTAAFTEYSTIYRQMSDEEKKGDFGQGLAQSLEQLRGRIDESRTSLAEVNAELGNTSTESNATGGVLETLAGKFGINITQAGAMGAALGLTTAATKVAKDAFFANEEQLDEWGRVVASSESLYRGFLNAINNGDISGFLNNMSSIVSAARAAYDAIDLLNTFVAFNQKNMAEARFNLSESLNDFREGTGSKEAVTTAASNYEKILKEQQKLEQDVYRKTVADLARTRRVNEKDLYDILSGEWGTYEELKKVMPTGKRLRTAAGSFGGTYTYTETYARTRQEQLAQALRQINDEEELKRVQAMGAKAFMTGTEIQSMRRQVLRTTNGRGGGASLGGAARGGGGGVPRGGGRGGGGTPPPPKYVPVEGSIDAQAALVSQLQKAWKAAADDDSRAKIKEQIDEASKKLDEMQGKIAAPEGSLKALKDEMKELQSARDLLTDPIDIQVQDVMIKDLQERIDALNGKTVTVSMEVADRSTLADQINAELAAAREDLDSATLKNLMKYTIENGISGLGVDWSALQQQMVEGMDITDESWQKLVDDINAKLAEMKLPAIKLDVKTGNVTEVAEKTKEGWQEAAKAVQSVSNALQQVEDPAIRIAGIVGEAIANIALGFSKATIAAAGGGPLAWIAAIGGGLGTMISTINAIKSATAGSYAEGGIIPGHSFSGDNMLANVNSGELILSRAAQGNLASQLSDASLNNLSLTTTLRGEDIRIALSNNSRRHGYGEIVTSRR